MRVIQAQSSDQGRWNAYVDQHCAACVYHRFEWQRVWDRAYGCRSTYWLAQEQSRIVGLLPLVELATPLFGRLLCSLPYFGHGGIIADNELIVEALAQEAARLARSRGARLVELRHLEDHCLPWNERRDKVNMVLPLGQPADEVFGRFKAKLRSQIRRPEKAGHQLRQGRHELLHAFWSVYSQNLRDLGSPCHSERLFAAVLEEFGPRARIFVVFDGHQPIAAGFVVGGQGTLEIPCASSLRSYNRTSPNMMLYGGIIRYACDEGYDSFNFGRSSLDSGTYRFKRQWGAEPHPLVYHCWTRPGSPPPNLQPHSPKFQAAVAAWQKLPLPVARLAGPLIVRGIP
jgi:FemAB-related protein (PEP-CTERM system-associated)